MGTAPIASRTTLRDVALQAGVSVTTASLVLNDREAGITEATKARVRTAADTLGYRPNASARALRRERTDAIALITDEIATTPYAGDIILGAQEAAWAKGQVLYIVNTNGSAELEQAAVETMLGRQIEGLLFASMHTRAVTLPAGVRDVATVLVNCFTEDRDGHHTEVLPDDRAGGREAVEILLSAGHTRIAVINGDHGTHAWMDRTAGARDAFAARDMELPDDLVIEGNWLPDGGYDITRALFSRADPPTALVCANDRTALGAYDALRELGRSIPADVSVVGYDDQEISRFLRPPLTTIALPHYELGRRACQLLLSGPRTSTRELVACPPRVRNSVAPPRL